MQGVVGVSELKRPPGPPPGVPPVSKLKPPPLAPPPKQLEQSLSRPTVENIKKIEPPSGPPPQKPGAPSAPPAAAMTPVAAPRAPPPRGPGMNMQAEFDPSAAGGGPAAKTGFQFGIAPAKPVMGKEKAARKAGAIEMFDTGDVGEPAEKKQYLRGKRPEPPKVQAPGIPEGFAGPPMEKFDAESKMPAAPVRPAPDRNRRPPKEEPPPDVIKVPKAEAPEALHPSFFVEKPKDDTGIIHRRDLPYPEFESSSDEDDDDAAKKKKKKKKSGWGDAAPPDVDKTPPKAADAADAPRPVTGDLADLKRQQQKADQTEALGSKTDVKAAPPLAAKDAWGEEGSAAGGGAAPPLAPLKLKFPVGGDIMGAGGLVPPAADAPQFGPPPDPVEEGVAEILREKQAADEQVGRVSEMSDGEADAEAQPEPDDDDGEGGDSPRSLPATEQAASAEGKDGDDDDDAASAAVSAAREPLTPDDLVLAAELPRGRLYITCVSGEEMRKKNETGKAGQRIDPYIKIRLGEGERHPFYNTQPVRKQGKDPEFNDEVLTFDIKDPFDYVLHGDLKVRCIHTSRVFCCLRDAAGCDPFAHVSSPSPH